MFSYLEDKSQLQLYLNYWKDKISDDVESWNKIRPMEVEGGGAYVVKCFLSDFNGPILEGLPYKLLLASAKVDSWSFGEFILVRLAYSVIPFSTPVMYPILYLI